MAKAAAKKTRNKDRIDRRTGVQEAIDMGINAVEQGDRKQAHGIFQQTADLHPNLSEVWVWLGGTSPNLEEAEAAFEKAYTIDPDNEQASLGLRWLRLRRKASLADIMDATVPVPTAPQQNMSVADVPQREVSLETPLSPPTTEVAQDADAQVQHTPIESKQGLSAGRVIFMVVVIIAMAISLSAWLLLTHPF